MSITFTNIKSYTDEKPPTDTPVFLFIFGYEDNIAETTTGTTYKGEMVRLSDSHRLMPGLDFTHWCLRSDAAIHTGEQKKGD